MSNRLTGVRLGRHERFVFCEAGSADGIVGLVIDPDISPSTQQGLLRAARKLQSVGLVTRRRVSKEQHVRDPRRERPYYDQGRFWVREEPSRRHYVTRIAVWRTPFGEEIHREFLAELQSNRAIRWDDRVSRAEDRVRGRPAPTYEAMAGQLDDRLRTRRVEEEAAREERHEYLPPEARSNKDKDRWRTAARLARKTDPKLGSERLLEKALALFESATSTEELRAQLGPVRRRSPDYTYSVMRGWSVR